MPHICSVKSERMLNEAGSPAPENISEEMPPNPSAGLGSTNPTSSPAATTPTTPSPAESSPAESTDTAPTKKPQDGIITKTAIWLLSQPRHIRHILVAGSIAWTSQLLSLFFVWVSSTEEHSTFVFQPLASDLGLYHSNKPLNFDPWLFSESLFLFFGLLALVGIAIPCVRRMAALFLLGQTVSLIPFYLTIIIQGWNISPSDLHIGFYLKFGSIILFLAVAAHAAMFIKDEFGRGSLYPTHRTRPGDIALTSIASVAGIGFLLYRFFPLVDAHTGGAVARVNFAFFGRELNTQASANYETDVLSLTPSEQVDTASVAPEVLFWGLGLLTAIAAITFLRRRATVPFLLGFGVFPFVLLSYLLYLDIGNSRIVQYQYNYEPVGRFGGPRFFDFDIYALTELRPGSAFNILAGALFLLGVLIVLAAISSGTPDERSRNPASTQLKFEV